MHCPLDDEAQELLELGDFLVGPERHDLFQVIELTHRPLLQPSKGRIKIKGIIHTLDLSRVVILDPLGIVLIE